MLRVVKDLRTASSTTARRARHLSIANKHIDGGMIQGSVGASKSELTARMKDLFTSRLGFGAMLFKFRVDNIAEELDREIARAFLDVEQQVGCIAA